MSVTPIVERYLDEIDARWIVEHPRSYKAAEVEHARNQLALAPERERRAQQVRDEAQVRRQKIIDTWTV